MKQRFLTRGSLLFLMVILAACGGNISSDGMDGMNMGGTPASHTTGSAAGVVVQVRETEYTITSSLIRFSVGISYHFVVTNTGSAAHEFLLMPKSMGTMSGMSMAQMDRMALALIETIAPGETKTVDYTFPSQSSGSHPELACFLRGQYEAGMKLDVTVGAV